jgi:two-component system phosphate regulon sensor histidine kinase PhoR
MRFLISDLVDFAAIESGKLRIAFEPMDVAPVLKDIQSRMEVVAGKKEVAFEASFPESLPRISGDSRRLAQVLQNLCSNGINYTPAKGLVRLSAEVVDGALKMSVQDSGIGIAPQDLPKIFNRFFQAENATKHRKAGFGLGLKIAREIVEAHKGKIEVTSVLGQGSTFFFSIPVLPF